MEERVRIQHPAVDILLDPGTAFRWLPPGFRIHLVIDENGYVTDEPRFHDGNKVPIDPAATHAPPNNSVVGYRVRLLTTGDDPPDNSADRLGCRLWGGILY